MNEQHLNGHHRTTLRDIFRHPLAQNLEWADVTSLVGQIGSVVERHDGEFVFDVGSQRAFFRRPHGKDMAGDDVHKLRKFLEAAGVSAESVPDKPEPGANSTQRGKLILVIDHHSARVFESRGDSGAIGIIAHIVPDDPHGFERHLEHKKEADYKGERIPEDPAFYTRVASALKGAATILIVGDSTGKSSAAAYLSSYLSKVHNDVFQRVVGTVDADLSALTDGKIKTLADHHFAADPQALS
jgi:hypothetical protein